MNISQKQPYSQLLLMGSCEPLEAAMKTQGEIEAATTEGIIRFEQEYMGRGPKDIHSHLINKVLLIRLEGVLTAAEQQGAGVFRVKGCLEAFFYW
jgi:hypothetical protein